MIWTVPNILTVLRLLAAPGIAAAFLLLMRPYADWVALILFLLASVTDWFDGYLARAWNQTTKLGTMLDPIADKAMVVIALAVLIGLSSLSPWLLFPATLILFREVFVSGLREFLGDTAGTLKVTKLAKWKTTVQMVAITVLLAHGLVEHYFGMAVFGMDNAMVDAILSGAEQDELGLRSLRDGVSWTAHGGVALLWLAALLTLITGFDYFRKAMPYLKG
ncbi:CDP-diacylglycerol--glycerol-3-phosphate 3-phosphatidyltransferase [Pseudoprimorskyibacter insulae]|uniref:CDP-diacylglycerol--glycerol-3-phosphate 3-phosphatidyltransferase n=1 Tax=Pseudoprimorskyibacter insulae TaxID=1695997 RepID=A0A2R8AN60_9RHOB|nr:CDP-diacylglycerol--glycerol-3-phosphate 3-phosphatidyltransferase [Pseudoprimorskyibacter insulae]SPF77491.1 CDP-diacylglycerol--glycerol-3-phosphate 3-phosphatidyltransferase [Pseudoprimorskyibacter insulae]